MQNDARAEAGRKLQFYYDIASGGCIQMVFKPIRYFPPPPKVNQWRPMVDEHFSSGSQWRFLPQDYYGGGGGGGGRVGSGGSGGGGGGGGRSKGNETNRYREHLLGRELGTFSSGSMAAGKSGTGSAMSSGRVDQQRSDCGRNGSDRRDCREYYDDHGDGDRSGSWLYRADQGNYGGSTQNPRQCDALHVDQPAKSQKRSSSSSSSSTGGGGGGGGAFSAVQTAPVQATNKRRKIDSDGHDTDDSDDLADYYGSAKCV